MLTTKNWIAATIITGYEQIAAHVVIFAKISITDQVMLINIFTTYARLLNLMARNDFPGLLI